MKSHKVDRERKNTIVVPDLRLVDIVVEGRKTIDVIPDTIAAGVKDVRAVNMHIHAVLLLCVNVSSDMRPFIDY